jgi:pyruvate formate lyase activating enzyme
METSGWFEFKELLPVIHEIDFLFIDLKIFDDTAHRHYTGKSNVQILENIKRIGALGKDMVIRIPLIPGVSDHIENLQKSVSFIRQEVPGRRVELLPYHDWAKNKYQALALPFHSFSQASVNSLENAAQFLSSNGCMLVSYK